MLKQKKLNTFFYSKWDKIEFHFITFCETGDHDHIHKLRLEFKKVRALISLIDSCNKNSTVKNQFKQTLVLYRNAGKVRDAYISLKLHSNLDETQNSERISYLNNVSADFCREREFHINIIHKWRLSIPMNFDDIIDKSAIDYFSKRLKKINSNLKKLERNKLHECRKMIKKLMYIYPLLPNSVRKKIKFDKNYFDTVQEMIGNWHDIELGLKTSIEEDSEDEKLITILRNAEGLIYESLLEYVNENNKFIDVK